MHARAQNVYDALQMFIMFCLPPCGRVIFCGNYSPKQHLLYESSPTWSGTYVIRARIAEGIARVRGELLSEQHLPQDAQCGNYSPRMSALQVITACRTQARKHQLASANCRSSMMGSSSKYEKIICRFRTTVWCARNRGGAALRHVCV